MINTLIAADLPGKLILTEDFKRAYDELENGFQPVIISGMAGTGKSTLLAYFKEKTTKKYVVLAPTGIAALNVGGQTIHSFFRFAPTFISEKDINPDIQSEAPRIEKIDIFIIDEISMVRADIMDGIDYYLRKVLKNNTPFGGKRMAFLGDLYQLPPVVDKQIKDFFFDIYTTEFFFGAKVFQRINPVCIELRTNFRQKDDDNFKKILSRIRENKYTEDDLKQINSRYQPNYIFNPESNPFIITLAGKNETANSINTNTLAKLTTPEFSYKATIEGVFDPNSYPTDEILKLKVGAQVMIIKNLRQMTEEITEADMLVRHYESYPNGTLGKVVALSEDEISVLIDNNIFKVTKETWDSIEYIYDKPKKELQKKVKGTFTQFPLKLAWAITIHKSQGKTFDNINIDLSGGAFAVGQTYVALSRCRTLNGIILKTRISYNDIRVSSKVVEFMRNIVNPRLHQ